MAATQKSPTEIAKARALNHVPWSDEYEKMISGMLYRAFVPELNEARFKARAFANKYNTYFPDAATNPSFMTLFHEHLTMLKSILGRIADDTACIEPPFSIDYGCNISLGKNFYSNFNLTILDCGIVTIGDRVMFGPNVSIFAATHETEVQSRRDGVEYASAVTIGDDCWIGGHVVILPGVTIGNGCTIGAGSVVTKDVPDWSVAIGSPAKVVKTVQPVPPVEEVEK